MIGVSQAVQSLAAGASSSVSLSRTALIAATFPQPAPSVRLSIGQFVPAVLFYTAAGAIASVSGDALAASPGAPSSGEANATSGGAAPEPAPLVSAVAPSTVAPPGALPASTVPETVAGTVPQVGGATPVASIPLDTTARALADFTANPVHGNLATALFINAANYRARQASSAVLVAAIEQPAPVATLDAINVDVADLDERASERRRAQDTLTSHH